jgi:trimethylamine:corrinoid methyltransferase-like protein
VSDETLAIDAIARSATEGNFLMDPHTLQHLRTERFMPHLLTREGRVTWEAAGAKDMAARAKERAQKLLKTYQADPLDEGVAKELEKVVAEAAKELEAA